MFRLSSFLLLVMALHHDDVVVVNAQQEKNVYGKPLQECSHSGMALTGFTRTGQCVDVDKDNGSHNVCLNIPSATAGNFCQVTKQPNWCVESNFPCVDDPSSETCTPANWCVCEWAFAGYLNAAGGCDKVGDIDCDATNGKILDHYQKQIAEGDSKAKMALTCVQQKCPPKGQGGPNLRG